VSGCGRFVRWFITAAARHRLAVAWQPHRGSEGLADGADDGNLHSAPFALLLADIVPRLLAVLLPDSQRRLKAT